MSAQIKYIQTNLQHTYLLMWMQSCLLKHRSI